MKVVLHLSASSMIQVSIRKACESSDERGSVKCAAGRQVASSLPNRASGLENSWLMKDAIGFRRGYSWSGRLTVELLTRTLGRLCVTETNVWVALDCPRVCFSKANVLHARVATSSLSNLLLIFVCSSGTQRWQQLCANAPRTTSDMYNSFGRGCFQWVLFTSLHRQMQKPQLGSR